jgi:diadenosine tetraphosphate (Ap4A) HIT family hydrolase
VKTCVTCELTANRHQGPRCERIYEDAHWRVVHAFNTSLPGWLVIVSMRHVVSFAELSEAEALSFGPLLHRVSRALQEVTGAIKTYTVLFAESPEHPHVHLHVIPRMADIPEDKKGPRVFDYLGVPEDQIVPLEKRNEIAVKLQELLCQSGKETL